MDAETTYPAIIGRILARKRKEKGLDQAEMSRLTGINRSSWSRIENGDANPSATQLAKIAEALKVAPQQIFVEAEEARKRLMAEGVKVHMETNPKAQKTGFGAVAMLGAAALGALVATLATKSKNTAPPPASDDNSRQD